MFGITSRSALATAATVTLAVVATFGVTSTANAAESSAPTPAEVSEFLTNAQRQAPKPVEDTALRSKLLSATEQQRELPDGLDIEPGSQEVLDIGSGYAVRSALTGDGVDGLSSQSVILDGTGNVIDALAYEFRSDGTGGGSLTIFRGGSELWSKTITATEATASTAEGPTTKSGDFWGKLNTCLANQGIAAWALALLAAACAAACVVTVGVACAACIGASIGLPSGVISACIAIASK